VQASATCVIDSASRLDVRADMIRGCFPSARYTYMHPPYTALHDNGEHIDANQFVASHAQEGLQASDRCHDPFQALVRNKRLLPCAYQCSRSLASRVGDYCPCGTIPVPSCALRLLARRRVLFRFLYLTAH
jgi:hypothetical protein